MHIADFILALLVGGCLSISQNAGQALPTVTPSWTKETSTAAQASSTTANVVNLPCGSASMPDPSTGAVSGTIINDITGKQEPNTVLTFRSGAYPYSVTGPIVKATVFQSNRGYTAYLPAGEYAVQVAKNGFLTGNSPLKVIAAQYEPEQNLIITPNLPDGQVQIVLTWGANPRDLDAHLHATHSNGSQFVLYGEGMGSIPYVPYAFFNEASSKPYGQETITILTQNVMTYRYSVCDYSNYIYPSTTALSESGAAVQIIRGSSIVHTFKAPVHRTGPSWTVFELKGDTVTPVNTMEPNC